MVLNLAKRAALAAGRPVPEELPESAMEAWKQVHWHLGGTPRLLCSFLEVLGLTRARLPSDQDFQSDGTPQAE